VDFHHPYLALRSSDESCHAQDSVRWGVNLLKHPESCFDDVLISGVKSPRLLGWRDATNYF